MRNFTKYGKSPFRVVVVHGGPGAGGEMAPVAGELASSWGVLEPIQSATSLEGQIEELTAVVEENGDLPVTLIGFSWGAWLSFVLAARHPALVRKVILIGSGPFEEKYAAGIRQTRLKRLSEEERAEVNSLAQVLDDPAAEDKNSEFTRFGALCSKADAYDPIIYDSHESEVTDNQPAIFQSVWKEAAELRRSGKLLKFGEHVKCSVVAIHGDYDPHPAAGVLEPLSVTLRSFRFVLLRNCGHKPWIERQAREKFYQILKEELR